MDIKPGMVFYLPFTRLHGQAGIPYNKFGIVVRLDPDVLMFLISTEIPRFAQKNPRIRRSYIAVDYANHTFLRYDSWIDCADAKDEYSLLDLQAAYKRDAACHVGDLGADILKRVVGGVDSSLTLERRKKHSIISALNQRLNELR